MYKSTKIILAVCAAAIVLVLGWFIINRLSYDGPEVAISYITSEDGENYITLPQIEMESRSSMGVSEEWNNRYFEAYDIIDKMMQTANSHRGDKIYRFDSSVEIVDGKTVFTLSGEYSVTGETTETLSESYYLDYVLTEDVGEK